MKMGSILHERTDNGSDATVSCSNPLEQNKKKMEQTDIE
jgi:hypothetical protein